MQLLQSDDSRMFNDKRNSRDQRAIKNCSDISRHTLNTNTTVKSNESSLIVDFLAKDESLKSFTNDEKFQAINYEDSALVSDSNASQVSQGPKAKQYP